MTRQFHRMFFGLSAAIVAIALVWGFIIAGSPITERARKFDERRLEDLRIIQSEVQRIVLGDVYRSEPPTSLLRPLPETIEAIASNAQYQRVPMTDPETGVPYIYRTVADATHYELCATFNFSRDEAYDIAWNHPAGQYCFTFDALRPQGPEKGVPMRPMAEPL